MGYCEHFHKNTEQYRKLLPKNFNLRQEFNFGQQRSKSIYVGAIFVFRLVKIWFCVLVKEIRTCLKLDSCLILDSCLKLESFLKLEPCLKFESCLKFEACLK